MAFRSFKCTSGAWGFVGSVGGGGRAIARLGATEPATEENGTLRGSLTGCQDTRGRLRDHSNLCPNSECWKLKEAKPGGFQTRVFPTLFGKGPDCVADPFGTVPRRCS